VARDNEKYAGHGFSFDQLAQFDRLFATFIERLPA
jgi:hypothetical protein